MKNRPVESLLDAEHVVDLVVERGVVIKNRYGTSGQAISLPDGYYALTRIMLANEASPLVQVSSQTYNHPFEGLIVCRDHLRQVIFTNDVPPCVVRTLSAGAVAFWNHRCLMCGVDAVPGRLCENEGCRRPLHPQWPAVYCKNACALEDT